MQQKDMIFFFETGKEMEELPERLEDMKNCPVCGTKLIVGNTHSYCWYCGFPEVGDT